jgi:predicted amidohydrolase YtcJ
LAALAAYAAANPQREWIEGVQLKYSAIPAGERLDRWMLDAVVPDRPVYLSAFDGHTVWANTAALRRGGILHGRATPAGSVIVHGRSHRHGHRRTARAGRLRPGTRPHPAAERGRTPRRLRKGWRSAPATASPAPTTWTTGTTASRSMLRWKTWAN